MTKRNYGRLLDPKNRHKPKRIMTASKLAKAKKMVSLGYKYQPIADEIDVSYWTLVDYITRKKKLKGDD